MSKEADTLDVLLNKYNRLVARYQSLESESSNREAEWRKLEQEFRINESLTRELCEMILAKNPHEMVLGSEYSWGRLPIRDIINRSKATFTEYNDSRTKLLREIQKQSEERRMQIESLKTQIEQDEHARERLELLRRDAEAPEADEPNNALRDIDDSPVVEVPEEVSRRAAYGIQQASERGDVEVLPFNDEEMAPSTPDAANPPIITEADIPPQPVQKKPKKAKNKNKKPQTYEEPKPAEPPIRIEITDTSAGSDVEIAQQKEIAFDASAIALERSAAMITPGQRKVNEVREFKKAAKKTMQVDLSEIVDSLKPRQWTILRTIGDSGMCEANEIVEQALEATHKSEGNTKCTASGIRYELLALVNRGCLTMDQTVTHPLKGRFAVYALSDIGIRIYKEKYGKDPAISEKDVLIANHDNLDHGFGIKALAQMLNATGLYEDITTDRKHNTVKLQDGTLYIADVMAVYHNGTRKFTSYFEYERGTHHQVDFNIKLNKAAKVTSHIDIVCPNTETVKALRSKVETWIESRGGSKNLGRLRLRLTSLRYLKDRRDFTDDKCWQLVYDMRKGDTPIEH